MHPKHIPQLASLLEEYYDFGELLDLARVFGVSFEADGWVETGTNQEWLAVAAQILGQLPIGRTRALAEAIVEQIDLRNTQAVARTDWERRYVHETCQPLIREIKEALSRAGPAGEIAVPASSPFAAKAELRELLGTATTDVLVVDPYIGVATLDCLRDVTTPVRLLTSDAASALGTGFERALIEFKAEGRQIEVRRGPQLHDRHVCFNRRCWLVGSSLKDAGKTALHCIEIHDAARPVMADLERRWKEAKPGP